MKNNSKEKQGVHDLMEKKSHLLSLLMMLPATVGYLVAYLKKKPNCLDMESKKIKNKKFLFHPKFCYRKRSLS